MKKEITVTEFSGEILKVADLLEYINSNNLKDKMGELYLEVLYDSNYGDGAIINIELKFDREETEQEQTEKLMQHIRRKQQIETEELAELLRLKQKYESE